MSDVLLIENRGAVRILTLNRPDKLNALNNELTAALLDGLVAADAAPHINAVILTATGRGFCVGDQGRQALGILAAWSFQGEREP